MRIFMGGFAAFLGLVAAGCLFAGVAGLLAGHAGPGITLVAVALVAAVLGWVFVWKPFVRRTGSPLTMMVCPDAITLSRHGQAADSVRRAEVGLVVIVEHVGPGGRGVTRLRVYGPDRRPVGSWDTNWGMKGSSRSIRAFRRSDFPWVVHSPNAVVAKDRVRSALAPSWTDEVLRS